MSFETSEFKRVSHALLVAEVRKTNQHAVDFIGMSFKQLRADPGIVVRLNTTQFINLWFGCYELLVCSDVLTRNPMRSTAVSTRTPPAERCPDPGDHNGQTQRIIGNRSLVRA